MFYEDYGWLDELEQQDVTSQYSEDDSVNYHALKGATRGSTRLQFPEGIRSQRPKGRGFRADPMVKVYED